MEGEIIKPMEIFKAKILIEKSASLYIIASLCIEFASAKLIRTLYKLHINLE